MQLDRFLYSTALAAARGCDFAHPGEAEGIDRLLEWLPVERGQPVLDFGCGLGGTANYLVERGWKNVVGLDRDPGSIRYARAQYPAVTFEVGTVDQLPESYRDWFSGVLAMNVLYLVGDKATLLGRLRQYLRPKARIVISDFVDLGGYANRPLSIDGERVIPHVETPAGMRSVLEENGWEVEASVDLTADYLRWYLAFADRIERRKEAIVAAAGETYHAYLLRKYRAYAGTIGAGALGGGITVARWLGNG